MAHELQIIGEKASMAYVGELPWHGLGQSLTENASIDTWIEEAGMNWNINETPLMFQHDDNLSQFDGKKVLYASNTGKGLGVVSNDYKVVQPKEVLEFFRDLTTSAGMKLTTAGVLFDGRRFWAMADTGRAAEVFGKDHIKGNLLLTTSCDGTSATTAMFTATRVVCNNTLSIALGNNHGKVRVNHSRTFDPMSVKNQLGVLDESWSKFQDQITEMSKIRMSDSDTMKFFTKLLINEGQEELNTNQMKQADDMFNRYKNGMGADISYGSLWGTLNAVTEQMDHAMGRTRSHDTALWTSWFGQRANMKDKAFDMALAVAS